MTNFAFLGIFGQNIRFGKIPYIAVKNYNFVHQGNLGQNPYYVKKDRILRTIYLTMTYFDHLGYF